MDKQQASQLIKEEAYRIGFGACGIAEIASADTEASYFDQWIADGCHAGMKYMENYRELRLNPAGLVEGGRSVISVALNYYPAEKQPTEAPQIAYYAYGEDYHVVVKEKLSMLLNYIRENISPFYPEKEEPVQGSNDSGKDAFFLEPLQARCFTDSAPILERYWAWKAGLGWIGKNTNLIIPGKGSFFFLGELVTDMELAYDTPLENRCGSCTRCLDACPTGALEYAYRLNANKCLSYLTIEHKGEIPIALAEKLGNRLYGCDTCQQACPWNRFAGPTQVDAFRPNPGIMKLRKESLSALTREEYAAVFKRSAVKRAKYEGLVRTIKQLK